MNTYNIIGQADQEAKWLLKLQYDSEIDITPIMQAAYEAANKLGYELVVEQKKMVDA